MSVPHTGRLFATIDGSRFHFDGNKWQPIDDRGILLIPLLQLATESSPREHFDIHELALHIFAKLKLGARARIDSWQGDRWPDENINGID